MKLYGNLTNRLEEGKMYCKEIEVGTRATIYMYSDRHAYEVIEVKEKEIVIRKLDAVRVDDNGMSDDQHYEYKSNEKNPKMTLVNKNGAWREVYIFNIKNFDNTQENMKSFYIARALSNLTEKQVEKFNAGLDVKKLGGKVNISFGIADEYYDFSF